MRRALGALWRLLKGLPLALIAPILLSVAAFALFLSDVIATLRPRKRLAYATRPKTVSASIVIPNWNGRDLIREIPARRDRSCATVPGK